MSKMRDADLPLRERIEHAIQRITTGQGLMRVPAEATDPDLVLRDCQQEIDRLTAENEALQAALARDMICTAALAQAKDAET